MTGSALSCCYNNEEDVVAYPISLDGNRLEELPPEIGQLAHLEWLDLDDNRLTTLPPEFARLQALTHLQIRYNRWETFLYFGAAHPATDLLIQYGALWAVYIYGAVVLLASLVKIPEDWQPITESMVYLGAP